MLVSSDTKLPPSPAQHHSFSTGGSNWYEHWAGEDSLGDPLTNVRALPPAAAAAVLCLLCCCAVFALLPCSAAAAWALPARGACLDSLRAWTVATTTTTTPL